MDPLYAGWMSRWQAALDACQRKGGETSQPVVMPPAMPNAVAAAESELGVTFPLSFRRVLTEFSAQVDVAWDLPDSAELPPELQGIFCGHCDWSLDEAIKLNVRLKNFLLPEDGSFDDCWRNAFLFSHVPNGDYLAFDMRVLPDAPVIYLSHEGDDGNRHRLGNDFIDFVERWSLLGCPGNEDWQMRPFLPDATRGLDVYGENAKKWREWFGLDFEVPTG